MDATSRPVSDARQPDDVIARQSEYREKERAIARVTR
jgi:hypothetical protein